MGIFSSNAPAPTPPPPPPLPPAANPPTYGAAEGFTPRIRRQGTPGGDYGAAGLAGAPPTSVTAPALVGAGTNK